MSDSPNPAAADLAKEQKLREKEERRRLKELELKMKNIAVGDKAQKPKMTKAERRALQEQQRAAKQGKGQVGASSGGAGSAPSAGGAGGGSGPGGPGREGREQRVEGGQHSGAGSGGRSARANMEGRVVPEDKRMYLYLHLDLPQHPPSSASTLMLGNRDASGHTAANQNGGDSSAIVADVKNAWFPPGPQVVVGMPRDDYVASEAEKPASIEIPGATGKPTTALLRDAMPPFVSGPGQRRLPKASGNAVGIPVHPRIKEIGLRMATMEISGSNARAIAVLQAFGDVIADYITPPNTTLGKHLSIYLSPQINFLVYQRPMCISMANAIRWLKGEIVQTSHDLKDDEAKSQLFSKIDGYIKERITAASDIIAESGAQKIQDDDVILTYGASSVVQKLLLIARSKGRRFRVIVVDSRLENEGQRLVRKLVDAGFSDSEVVYAPVTALSFLMRDASKVFLGAEAFFANGNMLSRAGTAMVAMAAHSYHVPVIVTCETYKFNERIQMDAVVSNELGVPDRLMYKTNAAGAEPVGPQSDKSFSEMEYSAYARDKYSTRPRWNNRNALQNEASSDVAATGKKTKSGQAAAAMSSEAMALANLNQMCPLSDWRSNSRLRLLNLMQDITPPEFVSVIITEVGLIPTTSIPVVLREYKNQI
ncbi:hypothetical protein LPJ78_003194 [Coemansia sp. RSA 989]|nr:hypothetical protein LPJ68_003966 [Coemansia sp. RSA 1086]KAJ1750501.1 hypothetical protein LPJ79_002842 [Coemansia sp. RSA 1821]KAJ1864695.1 hypothetical protein LPJ78_003194 [Coemansia sp. RSA 989]KAJ2631528.1 hypothetical protein H4R22_001915 [Coemansia sp. RSA 1290]KAJ2653276.1 hypothetical protein IWW40_000643 [Coemansia sp. RSA 1250]